MEKDGSRKKVKAECGDVCRFAVVFSSFFRQWQTGNGNKEDRILGKERVCKVEDEAWYGKRRNECQCERGYRGEDDVCNGNFIYYFRYWH